jgi:hypothetical protein
MRDPDRHVSASTDASFDTVKARYYSIPTTRASKNPSHLLDALVRHELFLHPRKDYRTAMLEILEHDPELKRMYAAS